MCGRYNAHVEWEHRWINLLGDWPDGATQGFNVAPTQTIAVFTLAGGLPMRWGLVPSWSKEPKTKYNTFNATIESIDKKPAYRAAWKADRRCLIPCAGYYEWIRDGNAKLPQYIYGSEDAPLFIAGLWEHWQGEAVELLGCTIITREPVEAIAHIHNRMPVIVPPEMVTEWLKGEKRSAIEIAESDVSSLLATHAVSTQVNNARNQGATLIEPI